MEIDHVFVFVEPDGGDLAYLKSLGLVETYRRTHQGQGTQNICFCFDNMYLECLWVSDVEAIRSPTIARTGLHERSQWRSAGTNPFGIAWRAAGNGNDVAPAMWAFQPPYLPLGMSIGVSVDSDDPRQPMMFRAPGSTPPLQWPAERRRALQTSAGLGRILSLRMDLPRAIIPSPTLLALAGATILDVQPASGDVPVLTCAIERLNRAAPLVIRLPVRP